MESQCHNLMTASQTEALCTVSYKPVLQVLAHLPLMHLQWHPNARYTSPLNQARTVRWIRPWQQRLAGALLLIDRGSPVRLTGTTARSMARKPVPSCHRTEDPRQRTFFSSSLSLLWLALAGRPCSYALTTRASKVRKGQLPQWI